MKLQRPLPRLLAEDITIFLIDILQKLGHCDKGCKADGPFDYFDIGRIIFEHLLCESDEEIDNAKTIENAYKQLPKGLDYFRLP